MKKHSTHPEKVLYIFDFDDTLVKTDGKIKIKKNCGKKIELTPSQYALYEISELDVLDFSDFEKVINPVIIDWVAEILKKVTNKRGKNHTQILTARANKIPIIKFLKEKKLPNIKINCMAGSSPELKSAWIEKQIIENKYDCICFFDDSIKNIEAVKKLKNKYQNIKFKIKLVNNI